MADLRKEAVEAMAAAAIARTAAMIAAAGDFLAGFEATGGTGTGCGTGWGFGVSTGFAGIGFPFCLLCPFGFCTCPALLQDDEQPARDGSDVGPCP